jgi:hypothetical protein
MILAREYVYGFLQLAKFKLLHVLGFTFYINNWWLFEYSKTKVLQEEKVKKYLPTRKTFLPKAL